MAVKALPVLADTTARRANLDKDKAEMTEQIVVPINHELLDIIDRNHEALEAYFENRLKEALERELFGGLTLAEYEDQLLYGTGEGVPMGIIRAETK